MNINGYCSRFFCTCAVEMKFCYKWYRSRWKEWNLKRENTVTSFPRRWCIFPPAFFLFFFPPWNWDIGSLNVIKSHLKSLGSWVRRREGKGEGGVVPAWVTDVIIAIDQEKKTWKEKKKKKKFQLLLFLLLFCYVDRGFVGLFLNRWKLCTQRWERVDEWKIEGWWERLSTEAKIRTEIRKEIIHVYTPTYTFSEYMAFISSLFRVKKGRNRHINRHAQERKKRRELLQSRSVAWLCNFRWR